MTAAIDQRLQSVAAQLEQLRREGWHRYSENRGVSTHRFLMNPPLDPASLQAFEERHGGTLPDDYRAFLLHVGNGGAGPYSGLAPLERTRPYAGERAPLARPCPLTATFERTDDWVERLGLESPSLAYAGTLWFVPGGATVLVVSGSARGRVVYLDDVSDGPPLFSHEATFLDWYERWVLETLGGLSMDGFDLRAGGSDEEHLATLASSADRQRRADAFAELARRRNPSTAVAAALLHAEGNFRTVKSRKARKLRAKPRRP